MYIFFELYVMYERGLSCPEIGRLFYVDKSEIKDLSE